jgi:hypothetical protein
MTSFRTMWAALLLATATPAVFAPAAHAQAAEPTVKSPPPAADPAEPETTNSFTVTQTGLGGRPEIMPLAPRVANGAVANPAADNAKD